MIELKTFFHGWREVTKEQAVEHFETFKRESPALSGDEKRLYYNKHKIRGAYFNEKNELMEEN